MVVRIEVVKQSLIRFNAVQGLFHSLYTSATMLCHILIWAVEGISAFVVYTLTAMLLCHVQHFVPIYLCKTVKKIEMRFLLSLRVTTEKSLVK